MPAGMPTPSVAIRAKIRYAMACSPPEMPVPAIAAAPATARSRFLGLAPDMTAARPTAATGVVLSIVVIHLGICACSSPCGRERNWRAATSSSKTPRTILIQLTQAAGEPDLLAPAGPARDSTMAPTMPRPSSQPATKAGPLTLARWLVSMSTTAMIGIGLSAMPTANGSDPPMALPIVPPLRCPAAPGDGRVQIWEDLLCSGLTFGGRSPDHVGRGGVHVREGHEYVAVSEFRDEFRERFGAGDVEFVVGVKVEDHRADGAVR